MATLQNYFRKIDKLTLEFESYFWTYAIHTMQLMHRIAKQTLVLIKNNHTSVIVRMVKIIEHEEKADEALANLELTSTQSSMHDELFKSRKTR